MRISWKDRVKIKSSPDLIRQYHKMYQVPCADSVIDFINRFCYTYDPRRKTDRIIPFELFDKQEEYIRWLWNRYRIQADGKDGVVDKCRGVGMSWMNTAFSVYLMLFQPSVTVSMYTYKADECHEKNNIDTLIEKCIFTCNYLPAEFTYGVSNKLMHVRCSNTGSSIIGKSGDKAGRGGRSSIFFLDEAAHYEQEESIEAASSRNSDCCIWGSTHVSTNTLFYRKCISGINDVFTIDWNEIPLYDQEWYDREREKAESEGTLHIFAREVERDAAASVDAVIIPGKWVSATKAHSHSITGKKIAAMDVADEGQDTNALCVIDGNKPIYIDEYGGLDPGDATDRFFWKAVEFGITEFRYDCIGVGVGVKVRLKEIIATLPDNHPAKKIKLIGWSAAGAVMRPDENDFQDKTNVDLLENAKSQAWWKAREEIRNTYRFVNKQDHDISQVVDFREIEKTAKGKKLMIELSQPRMKLSASGKILVDKKPKGTKSPNLADAYIIARAEVDPGWKEWIVI